MMESELTDSIELSTDRWEFIALSCSVSEGE
jgi:hypothetical protein